MYFKIKIHIFWSLWGLQCFFFSATALLKSPVGRPVRGEWPPQLSTHKPSSQSLLRWCSQDFIEWGSNFWCAWAPTLNTKWQYTKLSLYAITINTLQLCVHLPSLILRTAVLCCFCSTYTYCIYMDTGRIQTAVWSFQYIWFLSVLPVIPLGGLVATGLWSALLSLLEAITVQKFVPCIQWITCQPYNWQKHFHYEKDHCDNLAGHAYLAHL